MNEETKNIEEDFWEGYKRVRDELSKAGVNLEPPPMEYEDKKNIAEVSSNDFDFNKIIKETIVDKDNDNEDRLKKRNVYLEIGKDQQPFYLVLHNRISSVCFDAERIDHYDNGYDKLYLRDNILFSLNEIRKLEIKYPKEFDLAIARAVKMYLDSAIANLIKPLGEYNEISLDNAIVTIKMFKSLVGFEKEYIDKINKLKNK